MGKNLVPLYKCCAVRLPKIQSFTSMGLRNFLGLIIFTALNFMRYHTEHYKGTMLLLLIELIPKIPLLYLFLHIFSRDWIFRQCVMTKSSDNKGRYIHLIHYHLASCLCFGNQYHELKTKTEQN